MSAADSAGETPLHEAAVGDHAETLEVSVLEQIPLFGSGVNGSRHASIQALIENGAEVDAADNEGKTALHKSAGLGRVEAMRVYPSFDVSENS